MQISIEDSNKKIMWLQAFSFKKGFSKFGTSELRKKVAREGPDQDG